MHEMKSVPLPLDPDQLLTTTRAVRKRLDFGRPVDLALVKECLEIALQAPTGSNAQGWHFLVVTDAQKRRALAELYRKAWAVYVTMPFSAHHVHENDPTMTAVQARVAESAQYLADNLERVPVHVIPCVAGRFEAVPAPMAVLAQASAYGSILPAVWSFMLAARARGLGTSWTTLHLWHEAEAAALLGIPGDVTQCALIPVAHVTGRPEFRPGPRKPLAGVLHLDRW
jgi:nitroreductase